MAFPVSVAAPAVVADSLAGPAEDIAGFTARLVAGEDAAWTEAHRRYAPRLYRYLLVATRGDELAASDAMQAAFVRAVRHARVFHTGEALWGWLTLLARHALADARRSAGRWRAFLAGFKRTAPDQVLSDECSDPLPELLDAALASLSGPDRLLLEQKYFSAASVRELAMSAGLSEKALESRLTRARDRLRQFILVRLQS